MTSPFDWPALRSEPSALPAQLKYERGVWGKVHGARSDFRWIACSGGFQHRDDGLELQLGLGSEDQPCRAGFWRVLANRCYAVTAYLSRAQDAAGRAGALEKQVLEWLPSPDIDIPRAVGTLLLLLQAAQWTDEVWFGRQRGRPWENPAFALPLEAEACEPVPCSEAKLAQVIEQGLAALDPVPFDALRSCYAQLLSGRRPACLSGLQQPLPSTALAVLLLPLPREQADRLSLAGWIPSRRYNLEQLGNRWDVIALPLSPPCAPFERAVLEQAALLSRALKERNPALLRAPVTEAQVILPIQIDSGGQSSVSGTEETKERREAEAVQFIQPGLQLKLEPYSGAVPIVREVYEFARAVDRRWLDPDKLRHSCGEGLSVLEPSAPERELLCLWVEQVEAQRPYYADPEQWQIKVDLLRALTLILAPGPDTLKEQGDQPRDNRIPALLYADLLEDGHRDKLAELGEEKLTRLIRQSLACSDKRFRDRIESWLQRWQKH